MKTSFLIAGGLALSLLGTGCATKKYVAKSIAPVEQRVASTEAKNTDQDTKIAANATQIDGVDKDLSRTKERLNDVDAKAQAAAAAADAKAAPLPLPLLLRMPRVSRESSGAPWPRKTSTPSATTCAPVSSR